MDTSPTFTSIAKALAAAQGAFPPIEKNRTANIRSEKGSYSFRYADLAAILAAVRPALAANGIAILQPVQTDENQVSVRTWLVHESGEHFISDPISFLTGRDPKQTAGIISYARRYQLSAMLSIAADDDLDDEDSPDVQPARSAPPPPGNGRFTCSHGHKHDSAADAKSCSQKDQASPPDSPPGFKDIPGEATDKTLEPGHDPAAMDISSVEKAIAAKDWRAAMAVIGSMPRNSAVRAQAERLYASARSNTTRTPENAR